MKVLVGFCVGAVAAVTINWFVSSSQEIKKQYDFVGEQLVVRLNVHNDVVEYMNIWKKANKVEKIKKGDTVEGFATLYPEEKVCEIHVMNESMERSLNYIENLLGHEYLHCIYGLYH